MAEKKKSTHPLARILQEILATDPAKISQQKIRDSSDITLGKLDNEMYQYWAYLENLRELIQDLTAEVEDLFTSLRVDHQVHGNNIPEKKVEDFVKKLKNIDNQIHRPLFAYATNRPIFECELRERFPLPEGMHIHGIRVEGEVVCRKHDDRGDGRDPVLTWIEIQSRTMPFTSANEFHVQIQGLQVGRTTTPTKSDIISTTE